MIKNFQPPQIGISVNTLKKMQNIVDIMAELIGIPDALIMRLVESEIEVFVSSRSDKALEALGSYHSNYHYAVTC